MSSTHPRIAIIGGGPSGLVLLLTLHKRGIPATVYERDVTPFSRLHLGGTLDLRWSSGQRALRENGLGEVFDVNSRPEGDFYRLADKHGTLLLETLEGVEFTQEEMRPEIDRSVLRRILLDALPADSVKWDHTFTAVRPLGNGEHELTFANGTVVTCDVLVGADGAHSRIRPLVSPATPEYTGVNGAEISLAPEVASSANMADVRGLVGPGTLAALGDRAMVFSQVNGDGRVRAYMWHTAPEDWKPSAEPAAAREALRKVFQGWGPVFQKMIDNCDDRAIYHRPLYQLPVNHRWAHVDGVTLVGDASNLMTPYSGMGANLAMLEALQLGITLADAISAGKSLEEREAAVAKWETEEMFPESEKWTRVTDQNTQLSHSPGALEKVLEIWPKYMKIGPVRQKE